MILKYDSVNDKWSQVGSTKISREGAGAAIISYSDVQNSCPLQNAGFILMKFIKMILHAFILKETSSILKARNFEPSNSKQLWKHTTEGYLINKGFNKALYWTYSSGFLLGDINSIIDQGKINILHT